MKFSKILPFILAFLTLPFLMDAQITTSSISGLVKNASGNPLAGATITATHLPTGTVYTATARAGGRFDINNMNAGGPYKIEATFVGFETDSKTNLFLTLGETQTFSFILSDKTGEMSSVVVTARSTTSAKTGLETNIGRDKLALLPTVGRNLNDFFRFTPQAKLTATGGISLGGQNNRFNGFLIDGAVNNDVFGLSDQGTNGGRSGTPPISIDAIDQIVVQLSPYDAALGNFTGGAINAVTKSGTNDFHGSAYFVYRDQNFAGKTPGVADSLRRKLSDFKNQTYGFTLGGPIIKNKAFFFVNAEMQKDKRPQPYTQSGSSNFNVEDTLAKLIDHLKTRYNYDPGDWRNNPDEVERININTRFDVNLNSKNKLTLSYRYNKAERTNPSRSAYTGATNSASNINFLSSAEFFPTTTHSGNAELNTKFNNKMNNKFRVSFTDVVDDRAPVGQDFPAIQILGWDNGPNINIGSEVASSANLLKQRIINFYDAFKYYVGKHSFTIGADIDINKSYNLFMNRNYGLYIYNTLGTGANAINPLQAFMEDRGPVRYRRGYSLVDDGNKGGDANVNSAANFKSYRIGFFLNDDIRINDKLTLTLGVRADRTKFTTPVPEDKFFNDSARPVIANFYNLEGAFSGQSFASKWQVSPRLGFRYNLDEEGVIIRGGIGVFGGRTPFVWPGGAYQNTGVTIGAVDTALTNGQRTAAGREFGLQIAGQAVGFRSDVNNQYTQSDFGLSSNLLTPQGDLNIFSADFRLPAVIKASIGGEKRLKNGWTLGFDLMYTKNVYEVDWVNVNFAPPTIQTSGPGSRLVYSTTGNPNRLVYRPWSGSPAIRNPYSNIILVRNTTGQKGFAYNATFTIDKQTKNGFNFNAAYTYGASQVRNEGTSSINTSNWQNMEAVSSRNYLPLANSDFDLGHRVFALASKRFSYANDHAATTIAFTYTGQSGNRYSYTMSNLSMIGDGVTFNDLMYVPASRAEMDQMTFTSRLPSGASAQAIAADIALQKDQFETFINSDKYLRKRRGQFAERNGARAPFTHIVDVSVTQEFSVKVGKVRHAMSVRLDMFNFTNFIDKNAGRQYFFNFDQAQVLSFEGFTGTTPRYRFNQPANNRVGVLSDPASRWNGQMTIRYSF
ncbi:MAG TPA: TonB-dependent receptor [Ferruginibacter sp.]|nr:TonB-dependent receptor [Ferruginibacter sp.]